ncbi:hypothetical protein [Vibrio cholerae]|uniref:hypothetical protein n=1 Tax=Vibrio cholerae TaxID=666 RepID=UPI0006E4E4DE|nr:hypothetical protein [Vibrio cholerae]EJL6368084.1 hypothetical protein [Vibrio cholerae]KQA37880.1 hypothetical protein XV74_14955 [Vibrio cholerae]KQA42879.1 hypothetical protein XV75_14880 [Vibrio cholerae]KQA55078.1 hypothetical protein XV79_15270 [Vibrio cholerae]KQA72787.1 hypothetical protein XV84_14925 [Vibrio cholerae]
MNRAHGFFLFLLSIPTAIISALTFEQQGGFIIGGWFVIALALSGMGAIKQFIKERNNQYGITTGVVVGFEVTVKYNRNIEERFRKKKFLNPQVEYTWNGQLYTQSLLVTYDATLHRIVGKKLGEEVVLRVPLNEPQNARENTFISKYIYLIISVCAGFLSLLILFLLAF